MLCVVPLIVQTAFSMGIYSIFINLFEPTMKTDAEGWSGAKRDQYACLASVGLGVGEIVGALVLGRIQDNFSRRVVILANMFCSAFSPIRAASQIIR